MGNEVRYYLELMAEEIKKGDFVPQCIVTAVKLPTGSIEIAVNNGNIPEKIEYILQAYDKDMHLISNPTICMQNIMVV
jgi:hypothetical protein